MAVDAKQIASIFDQLVSDSRN